MNFEEAVAYALGSGPREAEAREDPRPPRRSFSPSTTVSNANLPRPASSFVGREASSPKCSHDWRKARDW